MSSDSGFAPIDELEACIQEFTCTSCRMLDRCSRSPGHECPISLHLPELLAIVTRINSDRMDPYVATLRQDVCRDCPINDAGQPGCAVRAEGRCPLDTFFLPIVTTIEDWLDGEMAPQAAA